MDKKVFSKNNESLPILYSFRRCPYAMRTRMVLSYSNFNCIIREVDLKNKPRKLLEISPKGTVPVLELQDGRVIDESLDIMFHVLKISDPDGILLIENEISNNIQALIKENDTKFIILLKKYKYANKSPENNPVLFRKLGETEFLARYDSMLENNKFLFGKKSLADYAILPFIRQFAFVDKEWFYNSNYKNLIRWLASFIDDKDFEDIVMQKYPLWKEEDLIVN